MSDEVKIITLENLARFKEKYDQQLANMAGYKVIDYEDGAEFAEEMFMQKPEVIRFFEPEAGLEVYTQKKELRDGVLYYEGSTFFEPLGGYCTLVITFFQYEPEESEEEPGEDDPEEEDEGGYRSEVNYYHSYSEVDFGRNADEEFVYKNRPMFLHMMNGEMDLFFQKTDFQEGELFYRAPIYVAQLGGLLLMSVKFFAYLDEETGVEVYDYDTDFAPLGGGTAQSDITIVTDEAEMADYIEAFTNKQSDNYKANHKYGLYDANLEELFKNQLSSNDLMDLMTGVHGRNRLITVNSKQLLLDTSVADTYKLHTADNSVEITLVVGEEDTVTVNVSGADDSYIYLEMIFFEYEEE